MIFILRKNFLDLGIWRMQKFDNIIYLIIIFYYSRFLQIFLGLEGKRFFLNIIRYSILEISFSLKVWRMQWIFHCHYYIYSWNYYKYYIFFFYQ